MHPATNTLVLKSLLLKPDHSMQSFFFTTVIILRNPLFLTQWWSTAVNSSLEGCLDSWGSTKGRRNVLHCRINGDLKNSFCWVGDFRFVFWNGRKHTPSLPPKKTSEPKFLQLSTCPCHIVKAICSRLNPVMDTVKRCHKAQREFTSVCTNISVMSFLSAHWESSIFIIFW